MVSFDIAAKFKQNKQRFLFSVILNQTQSQLDFVNVCQFTGWVSPDEKLG